MGDDTAYRVFNIPRDFNRFNTSDGTWPGKVCQRVYGNAPRQQYMGFNQYAEFEGYNCTHYVS